MPERSKRRKNNKNKRKNKNNRPDINQNNETTESLCAESCSSQISDIKNVLQEPKHDIVVENCTALVNTRSAGLVDNIIDTKENIITNPEKNAMEETWEETEKELNDESEEKQLEDTKLAVSNDTFVTTTNDSHGISKGVIKIDADINLLQGVQEQVKNNIIYEEHVTRCESIDDDKRTFLNDGFINTPNISSRVSENNDLGKKIAILNDNCAINKVDNISQILPSNIIKQICDSDEVINSKDFQKINKYIVESPDQTLKTKTKLVNTVKSKSLDNDDIPKITDVTEECDFQLEDALVVIDTNNVVISDVDSDVEWEKADELEYDKESRLNNVAAGEYSISTLPLNVAKCDETKSLTPEEEVSLRHYLQTLNLATNPSNVDSIEIKAEIEHIISREIKHRLRKKGVAEDFFCQRVTAPRILDVIDEEGSGESSLASRRQSYLSDKKSDAEDLDDVFEENNKVTVKNARKINNQNRLALGPLVMQPCLLVGTKIKEPEISEACGNWTVKTLEKMTGAEIIYLTDSSSSTSSIQDVSEETDDSADTDLSVRMITPTIEVTDTENLLKKTFLTSDCDKPSIQEIDKNAQNLQGTAANKEQTSCMTETLNNQNDTTLKTNNPHVIEILQTDNIKTNLYVKDLEEIDIEQFQTSSISKNNSDLSSHRDKNIDTRQENNEYSCEMKILKCELNDAINNLIKEVVSDSETNNDNDNTKDTFVRQDSSSSICSSQCTAKYNPTSTSLNDVSNILHDENCENNIKNLSKSETISHVKDVFEHVTGIHEHQIWTFVKQPLALKDLCVRKITTLPYGEKILEELADVSKRLQNITIFGSSSNTNTGITNQGNNKKKENQLLHTMPRNPLSDISSTEKESLHTTHKYLDPPPVKPRNSSLKKSQDDHHRSGFPTKSEPVYICLSPSQKMLMEKTNTVITNKETSDLVDMHKKPVDRKDYGQQHERKEPSKPEDSKTPSIVPFKSQTGSRLLALIRDPAVVNSAIKYCDFSKRSLDQLNKIQIRKERLGEQNSEKLNIFQDSTKNFKPIPPPRPRKISSSFYESDESSDFTDNSFRSIRSAKKIFHYSTGNLNKEIENDISSIQNMHRYCKNIRDDLSYQKCPRRPSLPKDLCDQQMEYIRQKEKEVEAELRRLEEHNSRFFDQTRQRKGPRAPMLSEKEIYEEKVVDSNNFYNLSKKEILSFNTKPVDVGSKGKLSSLFSSSQEEIIRDKMYSEYVNQMAERQERKQQKVIKITNTSSGFDNKKISKSMSALDILDPKVNNRIEKEFILKARERWNKLGIRDPETEDEREEKGKEIYKEPKVIEHKIKVIEDGEERDVKRLPNHLQEFVRFTVKKDQGPSGSSAVWRPGAPTPPPVPASASSAARSPGAPPPPPPPPVWTPGSAGTSPQPSRKSLRPVHFEETPPTRRKFMNSEQNGCTSGSESEGRLRTSHSAPATGLSTLGSTSTSRLPKAQNPTVTLLQKAREGQLPRGSNYLQQERDSARLPRDRASPPKSDPVHALRREYASEGEGERREYELAPSRTMADAHRKVDGIGPTTKEGMPVALRSEVKDPSRWYKKMYDTIHKNKYDDDYVTIRYKSRRGQPPQRVSNKSQYAYFDPRSGYLSEPEGGLSRLGTSTWSDTYDSDATAGPRRRTASVQEDRRHDDVTSPYLPNNKYSTLASARASQEIYRNQPGRIEDYVPGRSSVVDKEAKQWWDEVMDIFDGQISNTSTTSLPQASPKEKKEVTSAILAKSNMARALKESGYESDSTLVFRRREDTEAPLSPAERRAAYRDLQAGGEPPFRGFRSPAPPRQETDSAPPEPPSRANHGSYSDTESPRRYVESDVNIHYRCPVRHDPLPLVPERELARQQAEHMKRLYREQRRNKYLQELQDMQHRRHQDNFTPSQKAVVPLNRYDEADKVIAKAIYAFNGQTARELSFRKGELINVRRQIDANWYEGEVHGRIGLFPYNYIELLKGDVVQTPKKPVVVEGRAKAKFDFTAQTNLELPLKKGEVVVLTRRIDHNWWEGRNGNKTGIFPDSYVTVLQEPSQNRPEPPAIQSGDKPMASPAAHGLLNGSAKRSMGAHSYTPQPNSPALSNAPQPTQPLPGYVAKPAQTTLSASERGYGPPTTPGVDLNNTEPLYVDTNAEAVPYRAMYKYRPQNPDELELNEGDTVYVLEKCDDGWYVGSSQRTGRFGTFPGNYVERI